MNRALGYAVAFDQNGKVIEHETFTCRHCQTIVVIAPKADPADMGGHCQSCNALICPDCTARPCDHFEKKLERAEASYHARRSYGL